MNGTNNWQRVIYGASNVYKLLLYGFRRFLKTSVSGVQTQEESAPSSVFYNGTVGKRTHGSANLLNIRALIPFTSLGGPLGYRVWPK